MIENFLRRRPREPAGPHRSPHAKQSSGSRDDRRPEPKRPMTAVRFTVAVTAGAVGLVCVSLLLYDLVVHHLAGPAPIIETLIATLMVAVCITVSPGKVRRAAAASTGGIGLTIATVAIFANAPSTSTTSISANTPEPNTAMPLSVRPSPARGPVHTPDCPLPASSPKLGRVISPEPSDRTSTRLGKATIDGAESDDGKPGIGPGMVVCVTVKRPPTLDRQLWLVIRLNPREGLNHRLYFPKANITSTSGRHTLTIRAHCPSQTTRAGVGNSRTLMIVSADVSAVRSLQRNYDADQACDPGFDNSPLRRRLPTGAVVISNQGNVTRTW